MRYLDMPPGNGQCTVYRKYLDHIRRGRAIAIIPTHPVDGFSCYIFSGEPLGPVTPENSILYAIYMATMAVERAQASGYHPKLDTGASSL